MADLADHGRPGQPCTDPLAAQSAAAAAAGSCIKIMDKMLLAASWHAVSTQMGAMHVLMGMIPTDQV